LLLIKLSAILIAKVFVLPPVCPSNSKLFGATSPLSVKVVALASLSALPALPLTVPLTLPWIFPKNVVECISAYLLIDVPMFLVLFESGAILPVCNMPFMSTLPPTYALSAIPMPPVVVILPVPIDVEFFSTSKL